jgi:hypothetical protein
MIYSGKGRRDALSIDPDAKLEKDAAIPL